MSALPEIGRWIQYEDGQGVSRCKACRYEDEWSSWNGPYQGTERKVVLEYDGGDEDSQGESFFRNLQWIYIPAPGREELDIAIQKRDNEILGIFCETCKLTSVKLVKCSTCKKVHYCDRDCQRKDWPTHRTVCAREEDIVLQPNPRYPLDNVNQQLAASQKKIQEEYNAALKDAFNGTFKIKINEEWVRNPKASDLQTSYRYELIHEAAKDKVVYFKHRALESLEHTNGEPSACGLLMTMELCMENNTFEEGGLHSLVGWIDPGYFWGMVLNYFSFDTVAPFHTNCSCKFPKMPPKYEEIRKKWDKMFSRAKACPMDVQCMFADTNTGCHSFGLNGDAGCKFKHDIAVKKARK